MYLEKLSDTIYRVYYDGEKFPYIEIRLSEEVEVYAPYLSWDAVKEIKEWLKQHGIEDLPMFLAGKYPCPCCRQQLSDSFYHIIAHFEPVNPGDEDFVYERNGRKVYYKLKDCGAESVPIIVGYLRTSETMKEDT